MQDEIWKPLPGFDEYEVSNLGNARRSSPGKGTRRFRVLKLCEDRGGRLVFNARCQGKTKQWKIHRAVMAAFIGECPSGKEVAHLDGNQKNNALSNLIYATHCENNSHKVIHKTQPKGTEIWCSKLTESDVLEIRANSPSVPYSKIAAKYGVSVMTISQVVTKKTWKHV